MQHGSRQVDHRTQRALRFFRQPGIDFLRPVFTPRRQRLAATNHFSRFVEHLTQQFHHAGVTISITQRKEGAIAQ
ncbi:hypothetical protein ExPUPEC96_02707 [Escherichia coli]|nr:hypothetical protein ExPUPEC96_02707 [Escherichia coli]